MVKNQALPIPFGNIMIYDYNVGLPMKIKIKFFHFTQHLFPNLSQTIDDSGVHERIGWALHSSR